MRLINSKFDWIRALAEQLQNTRPLIYMSLNKNSVYCVMPRSSKPSDTCKWDGPKWPGILQLSRIGFEETRTHDCNVFEEKYIAIFRWINKMKLSKKIFVVEYGHGICDDSSTNNLMVFSLSSLIALFWSLIKFLTSIFRRSKVLRRIERQRFW